jgi:nicotinamide mononucleotide transporter
MMARKILENWIVWVAVDVVYIGMFLFKNLL